MESEQAGDQCAGQAHPEQHEFPSGGHAGIICSLVKKRNKGPKLRFSLVVDSGCEYTQMLRSLVSPQRPELPPRVLESSGLILTRPFSRFDTSSGRAIMPFL